MTDVNPYDVEDYIKELQEKNKKNYVFNTITEKSLNWQDIEY